MAAQMRAADPARRGALLLMVLILSILLELLTRMNIMPSDNENKLLTTTPPRNSLIPCRADPTQGRGSHWDVTGAEAAILPPSLIFISSLAVWCERRDGRCRCGVRRL